ncbi:hypothetical protein DVW87_05435 [Sphingomonas aracearum]|uniref:DUF4136 domain-containing protein n=2 Tax=Sphingomonas aracearum TaxID=2283317 RepID=A0A369VZN0_9SPHN|nr:hypothetical protein DVW87_05435 [Sphingomonas aracearum]
MCALALALPAHAQEGHGTITVEPLPAAAAPPDTREAFAEAVSAALLENGFLALPHGQGRYVARMTLIRTPRGIVTGPVGRSGPTAALGNWGGGVQVALPTGKKALRTLFVTELVIEISPRGSTRNVWRGEAVSVKAEGSAGDTPGVLAPGLARAALRAYPRVMQQPVAVP